MMSTDITRWQSFNWRKDDNHIICTFLKIESTPSSVLHERTEACKWNSWNTQVEEQGKSEGFDSCDRPSNLKLDSNRQFFRLCDREIWWMTLQQGKSEGFESCDRPIVRKRPIWVKIGDVLSRVILKFDGWPWKTIGHLSFAVSSFVQHCIAIGEFKLELLSGNAQFGSNSTIFRAVWPWNLTYDLEKQ